MKACLEKFALNMSYRITTRNFPNPAWAAGGRKLCRWSRRSGEVLPCHAAKIIPKLSFDNVRRHSVREIWESSGAFQKFRGPRMDARAVQILRAP